MMAVPVNGGRPVTAPGPFRAAVVQAAPVAFDPERTFERLTDLAGRASAEGARIIVFPEAFVGGYPKGADFGARVGSRSPEGREWFRRYMAGAIEVPGPGTRRLGAIARSCAAVLVVGVIERDRGTLYCTALVLGPDGELLGKHRKVMPTAMERVIWGFGDGSTLSVVETPVGRVGAVICWESYMPQLRLAMYGQGIQLYCAPTVDDRETWLPTMRHIALEGRCFVLSACQFARRSDYPTDYPVETADAGSVLIAGGSCIVDPLGRVVAGPARDGEAVIVVDLDPADLDRAVFDLDVVGHYARPDIFRLEVDTRARSAVTLGVAPSAATERG